MLSTRVKKFLLKGSFTAVNLCVDIGNTLAKCALFEGDTLIALSTFKRPAQNQDYSQLIKKYRGLGEHHLIISDVTTKGKSHIEIRLGKSKDKILLTDLKLPVKIKYKAPATLGADRLALACGAAHLYPRQDTLIISAGTCITMDIITAKKEYLGGAISPGLHMRLNALHLLTAKLPLVTQIPADIPLTGRTTTDSMLSGAINGAVAEIAHTIDLYSNIYNPLCVILCGGDAAYLQARLKCRIFAQPNLTLIGLNTILKLNAKNLNSA